jgi:hypothetical protein
MIQREFLGVHNLLEEVQHIGAKVVGMNVDIGCYLGVQISALCAVLFERPFDLVVRFIC